VIWRAIPPPWALSVTDSDISTSPFVPEDDQNEKQSKTRLCDQEVPSRRCPPHCCGKNLLSKLANALFPLLAMYLATVDCASLNPELRARHGMRSRAPTAVGQAYSAYHAGGRIFIEPLADATKCDFQRQYSRKPVRWPPYDVSSGIMSRRSTPTEIRYSQTKSSRFRHRQLRTSASVVCATTPPTSTDAAAARSRLPAAPALDGETMP